MEAYQGLAGRKDIAQQTEVYLRPLTTLKEKFYPIPVKKTLVHFNQVKEGRLIKANSKTSKLESNKSFLYKRLNKLQAGLTYTTKYIKVENYYVN